MAQTAIEVATENVLDHAFDIRGIEDLKEIVLDRSRGFSLVNRRLYALYRALTRDDLKATNPALWQEFKSHVRRRNDVVHRGTKVLPNEAQHSVRTAEELVVYLSDLNDRLASAAAQGAA
jgi:UTP:GlnB (protein PII) uridylyltransferase